MLRAVFVTCLSVGLSVGPSARAGKPDLQSLYSRHRYFELRDAVQAPGASAPAFYKAIVAAAFSEPGAENLLKSVIQSAPRSREAADAREQLEALYFRTGRYPEALAETDEGLAVDPANSNAKAFRALLSALPQAQSTAQFGFSRLPHDGLTIPVSINGKSGNYYLDSDSNISMMSESEARRLGLAIRTVSAGALKAQGAVGTGFGYEAAVAPDFVIGNIRLKNVAFLVVGDDQEPFVDLPAGTRAMLGLPVLLAFRTVRWGHAGTFDVGFASAPRDIRKSNIYFDKLDIIASVEFEQHKLGFVLDTGSDNTDLWPPFATTFAGFVNKAGKKTSWRTTGYDGSGDFPGLTLPQITLRAGGFNGTLRPGRIFLKQPGGNSAYYGRFGMTFLDQAHRVTLDVSAMTLQME